MKYLKSIAVLLLALMIIGCSAPEPDVSSDDDVTTEEPGTNPGTGTEGSPDGETGESPEEEIVSSTLTFETENVKTISPYSYNTTVAASAVSSRSGELSYLSYNTDDSANFLPMVFTSDNGTKIIFGDSAIKELDDGYYFVYIGSLQTVRKEPTIIYKEAGEDEFGNIIYEEQEVLIDVSNYYGENYAIIDLKHNEVYLINDPYNYSDRFYINWENKDSFYVTEEAFYFEGYKNNGKRNLYRIEKDKLGSESLRAVFSNVFGYSSIRALSEDYILVEGENGLYVMDRVSGYSPTRIVPEDYSMEYNEKHDFTYPFQNNDCSFINGNGIYDFSISWVYNPSSPAVVVTVLNVSQGDVSFEGVEFFPVNTTPENYGPYLEKVYTGMLDGKNAGIFVVNTAYVSGLFYYALDNGTPEVKFIPFEGTDRTAAYFRVNGSRVYWIGGENDNANGSYIRYYDFSTMNEGSFKIPGKPAASSDFSISDNGTVIYWQYLDDIQVGTYSWNPDKESYPTLIMTTDGDVHSMVNVSTL